jgi:hypothetical protein
MLLLPPLQTELVEWQLITLWSHTHHNRLPAAFKAAVKTLLLAAAQHHGTMSPAPADSSGSGGSSSSSHQQLLAQVPGPVLEQVSHRWRCHCVLRRTGSAVHSLHARRLSADQLIMVCLLCRFMFVSACDTSAITLTGHIVHSLSDGCLLICCGP